jgi:hypothetical protein
MNLTRKFTIPAIAAVAALAGGSAAVAVPAVAMAAVVHTAPAVHVTMAHSPITPAIRWFFWDNYPTLHACNVEGDHLFQENSIRTFKCVEASGGEFLEWQLFVVLGRGPGA